jgi:GTP cyclohydrolase I
MTEDYLDLVVQGSVQMSKFLDICVDDMNIEARANTPMRFTEAFLELMGQNDDPWEFTTFESTCDEMVIIKDIDFVTLCEHHLLPFIGVAHIGYIPQGRIAGLSKIARAVKDCCRGLWAQEVLTAVIADYLTDRLEPSGVAVVMEAEHTCMGIRGVKTARARTTTSCMRGVFLDHTRLARSEFLGLIK